MNTAEKSFIGTFKEFYSNHKELVYTMLAILAVLFLCALIFTPKLYSLMLVVAGIFIIIASGKMVPDGKTNPLYHYIAFACLIGAVIIYVKLNANEIELADYRQVKEYTNNKTCDAFLAKYPHSKYYDDVLKDYYYYCDNVGVTCLDEFSQKYKNTTWGQKAADRVPFVCDSLYNAALKTNTVEGWTEYKSLVPQEYYSDADERIDSIASQQWNTEPNAWSTATEKNTPDAYHKYLKLFPDGAHQQMAHKKLIDNRVAIIMNSQTLPLPKMEHAGPYGGSTSTIILKNSTEHIIDMLYSGPESKSLKLECNQEMTFNLKNGKYNIAASLKNANSITHAGKEEFKGGTYYIGFTESQIRVINQ